MSTARLRACAVLGVALGSIPLFALSADAIECPNGKFSTTGKDHGCTCPAGKEKLYSGVGSSEGRCVVPPPPPPAPPPPKQCPSGTFSTTGSEHGCRCAAGTQKEYSGIASSEAKCVAPAPPAPKPAAAPSGPARCPSGKFATTGKDHGCACPSGTRKMYSGIGSSEAECAKPEPPRTCPASASFKTTGEWHGCRCPAGEAKIYTSFASSDAVCKSAKTVHTAFTPEKNGFQFGNNCSIAAGCCTAMAWGALDYFWAHEAPPSSTSITPPIDRWLTGRTTGDVLAVLGEFGVNWAAHTADFAGVMQHIDRGEPQPLGLLTTNKDPSWNHSVVAYGYQVVDANSRDVLIYDVDYPGDDCVLHNVNESVGTRWHEECYGPEGNFEAARWLGFFIEDPYGWLREKNPPKF